MTPTASSSSSQAPGEGQRWGVADDGSVAAIVVPARTVPRLDSIWPPRGLAHVDQAHEPVRLRLEMRDAVAGTLLLEVNGAPAAGGWDRMESDLALFAAERLRGLVAVHAAVIVRGGRALVLPGPSGSGKSRLCLAALEAGADVLSDEYALLDQVTGSVVGWPRPIRVRQADGSVERMDRVTASGPVTVGLVALARYQPGATTALETITTADAALGLLANTVCAQTRPDDSFDAALKLARSCPVVAGVRGDAGEAIRDLFERLESTPTPS